MCHFMLDITSKKNVARHATNKKNVSEHREIGARHRPDHTFQRHVNHLYCSWQSGFF